MIAFPNAKINLGLNVVGRRADGYHNLETVFYPIDVCDALEFVPAEQTSLEIVGLPIVGDWEKNLVVRAFRLLQREFQLPELRIVLLKKIPMGAGLGGGSSDAAFMLKMLNEHFSLGLSAEDLEKRAAALGADCAFFVKNKPVFAEGIGNEFSPLLLSLTGWKLVLVKPEIHISTAEAYAHVACERWQTPLAEAIKKPISEWKNLIFNDFEASVFPQHPQLADVKQKLYNLGATYAAMSGSGSTIYGLFAPDFDTSKITLDLFPQTQFFQTELK